MTLVHARALLIVLRKPRPRCRFRHRIYKLPLDLTAHTQRGIHDVIALSLYLMNKMRRNLINIRFGHVLFFNLLDRFSSYFLPDDYLAF